MQVHRASMLVGLAALAACSDPAPTTGSLAIEISGLPDGVPASVLVVGPNQFQRPVTATTTLSELAPGEYQVRSVLVTTSAALYGPASASQPFTIVPGQTASSLVVYSLASGAIAVSILGVPGGIPAVVRVLGNGVARQVPATATVGALPPGEYRVLADTFASGIGDRYGATEVSQTVMVPVSQTPVPATVQYSQVSATLNLTVTGLASGPADAVGITGPGGFVRTTALSTTFRGLTPGTYNITANTVSACPNLYAPATPQQSHALIAGTTTEAAVAYTASTPPSESFNLRIAGAYLAQSVQRNDGTIPIVAGRPALLRVFGVGNQCNSASATVRVRFSNGDSVIINSPQSAAPLAAAVAPLSSSWNAFLAADRVQPNLTFVADIDPQNTEPEANESDNRYPAVGEASANVVAVPPLNLTFVPVTQSGVTGDVHVGNTNSYLLAMREMLPFAVVNVSVAPPLTSQVNFGNGGLTQFQQILQEVEASRAAQPDTSLRYYGVIRPAPGITFVTYGGMAYVPGKSAVGIQVGWFNNPRQSTELVAHELSHAFGRRHAPCGAAGSPDQAYPYAGGTIGTYGYDVWNVNDASLVSQKTPQTPDIMGYCQLPWVSDYTFEGVLNFRRPIVAAAAVAQGMPEPQSRVLVTGKIDRTTLSLDPVFTISAAATAPPAPGPYAIEGRDAEGVLVFRTSFGPTPTDHGDPAVHYFAFAMPVASAALARVREFRLTGPGRTAFSRASSAFSRLRAVPGSDSLMRAGMSVVRRNAREVELTWNPAEWPAVLVRDPGGNLLAIGRRGSAVVVTDQSQLDLLLSDGVRSLPLSARVPRH